ncbi:MAG: branched-chain amino acid aminotransferase [Selenomonas sp.]|nr:branched-chain amino acid aminotransferase [Selenomonas sp.]
MANVNVDWANLGFSYQPITKRYVANYKDGKWGKGGLTEDANVVINECAGILQYCQEVFEGLKAYKTKDGKVVTFRPDQNAKRMVDSAKRLVMPPVPEEMFLEAVDQVVKANADWIPPYETGGALYLRPYLFATGPVIGVKPADEYQFRLFGTPVGSYFKNGIKPITICVSDFDRAAPHGTGNIKAGLNYAMSLHAIVTAHKEGFAENIYLDPATRTKIEETGGANIILTDGKGTLVVPKSDSILPSITRRSLVYVAEHYCGMKIEEREVYLDEIMSGKFTEGGLCGTAAVISPLGSINDHGKEFKFASGMDEMGPVMTKLRETLTGIQMGTVEAPEGWIMEIKV